MSQFLFSVEIPPVPAGTVGMDESPAWRRFVHEAIPKLLPDKIALRIDRNVWLLPTDNMLPRLTSLSELARSNGLRYSCLLLPADAQVLALQIDPRNS
jgi:hypothetical protein